jgi:cation transport ATPase
VIDLVRQAQESKSRTQDLSNRAALLRDASTAERLRSLGYNAFAIPLAAGVLHRYGIILSPALGAVLMSLSTVIVAINARLLRVQ